MTLKYGNVDIDKLTGKIYKNHLMINYDTKKINSVKLDDINKLWYSQKW